MQKIKVINYDKNIGRYGVIKGNYYIMSVPIHNHNNDTIWITIEVNLQDDISIADSRVTVYPGTQVWSGSYIIVTNKFISDYINNEYMRGIIRKVTKHKDKNRFKSLKEPNTDIGITYPKSYNSRFDYISYHDEILEPSYSLQLMDCHPSTLRCYYNDVKTLNYTTMVDVLSADGTIFEYPITFEISEKEFLDIVNGRIKYIKRRGANHRSYYRSKDKSIGYVLPFEITIDDHLRKSLKDVFKRINKQIRLINGISTRNQIKSNVIPDGYYGAVYNGSINVGRKITPKIDQRDYFYDDIIKIMEEF